MSFGRELVVFKGLGSQHKFELWDLTIGTTTTKLSLWDKMCFHPENIISGLVLLLMRLRNCGDTVYQWIW